MDITKLKENIITAKIVYRGQETNLEIAPDADGKEGETNAEFAVTKIKGWDITDKGEPFPITLESMMSLPADFFELVLDKIYQIKRSEVGKLKVLGK